MVKALKAAEGAIAYVSYDRVVKDEVARASVGALLALAFRDSAAAALCNGAEQVTAKIWIPILSSSLDVALPFTGNLAGGFAYRRLERTIAIDGCKQGGS